MQPPPCAFGAILEFGQKAGLSLEIEAGEGFGRDYCEGVWIVAEVALFVPGEVLKSDLGVKEREFVEEALTDHCPGGAKLLAFGVAAGPDGCADGGLQFAFGGFTDRF